MNICSVAVSLQQDYCAFTLVGNTFGNLSDVTHTDHGRSPGQGRPGALVEVICRHHASVRHLEAGVHINTTRHHHSPMSLYDLNSPGNNEVVSDLPEGDK